jgi:hypothetical protein
MRIEHVDRHGDPDQPLVYVLRKALRLQAKVWGTSLLIGAGIFVGVSLLIELLKSR